MFLSGVSWSQSCVFFKCGKMTALQLARLDRFSHIALKLTQGLQNLCSFFRLALLDNEIYPLELISKEWTDTSLVVISVIKSSYMFIFIFWVLAFWIFVSNGIITSKISIFSSIISIITRTGFCAVTEGYGTGCRHISKIGQYQLIQWYI